MDIKSAFLHGNLTEEIYMEKPPRFEKDIKLLVGDWQFIQKLDYEQLSFKCRSCHEYGHFARNFPKIQPTQEKE